MPILDKIQAVEDHAATIRAEGLDKVTAIKKDIVVKKEKMKAHLEAELALDQERLNAEMLVRVQEYKESLANKKNEELESLQKTYAKHKTQILEKICSEFWEV